MEEIVQNAVTAICEIFQYLTCMVLQWLARSAINNTFSPSLDTFITGTDGYGGVMTQEMYDSIQVASHYISISLCVIIFILHLWFVGISAGAEMREHFGQLIIRFIMSIGASFFIVGFLNFIMTYATGIFDEAFNNANNSILNSFTLSWDGAAYNAGNLLSFVNPENFANSMTDTNLEIVTNFFSDKVVLIEVFKALIQIVFFCIVIYNFAKLVIEQVRRYITMCVLHILSPLATPFYTSDLTQNIFFSYVKLFAATVGVLQLTKLWIHVSLYAMATMNCNFINMCIMIAIIQIGIKFESLAKDLGLTTANLGGSLLDNIMGTGAAMAMIVSKSSGAAGEALINLGGAAGSLELSSLGSALSGKPMSFESRVRTMSDSIGAQMRATATKGNMASNLTGSQMKAMDAAIDKTGLFRNMSLQNVLGDLNKAGYKEAMEHIASSEFGSLKDAIGDPKATITPTSYSQNSGLGFEYKSSANGVKRTGYISDNPKSGKGITSIPLELDNGKRAFANFDPVSMDSLHTGGRDAFFNTAGEKLGGDNLSTMELDTGLNMSHFSTNGDMDATHYAATLNNSGGIDIMYNQDGINPVNLDSSNIVGAITKDGYNLRTSDYTWGNNGEKTPEQDIYDTLTAGSWSNRGFSDIKQQDITYDSSSGTIHFSATNSLTGKRGGYTAVPSVSMPGSVTSSNTITDSVHGSYTFSPSSNRSEKGK